MRHGLKNSTSLQGDNMPRVYKKKERDPLDKLVVVTIRLPLYQKIFLQLEKTQNNKKAADTIRKLIDLYIQTEEE